MKPIRSLAALACLLALAAVASAEIYRWTDANGVTHYTTDINQVPAAQRAAASAPRGGGSLQRVESKPRPPAPAATASVPASPAAADAERIAGKDEGAWRTEAEQLRRRVALYEPIVDRCKGDSLRISAHSSREQIREESEEAAACDRSRSELELAARTLADFEERAHRAGVPPGWIRE